MPEAEAFYLNAKCGWASYSAFVGLLASYCLLYQLCDLVQLSSHAVKDGYAKPHAAVPLERDNQASSRNRGKAQHP